MTVQFQDKLLSVFFVLCLGVSSLCHAQESDLREQLQDERRVVIEFDGIEHFFSANGFSQQALRQSLTDRLTASGFDVRGQAEAENDPGVLTLTIKFHVNQGAMYLPYLFYIKLYRRRPLADQRGYILDELWSSWTHGMTEIDHLDRMYPYIHDLLDEMVEDALGYIPAY